MRGPIGRRTPIERSNMNLHPLYQPTYSGSHALIIGINRYQHVSPLSCARNDAEAIADILIRKFRFPSQRVSLLTDAAATRDGIRTAFFKYVHGADVQPDDRIIVFFAGHGHTVRGRRGETGFLIPVDGKIDELATLVRWDDLTSNAELIGAKHIFFLMDACYGGLALSRKTVPPGSMRFLKDMLQRYSRQVLTAGKADEPVADAGGPRAGHSVFTGHVLDLLDGLASTKSGIITANALMAYVYERVGNDPRSRQTPHYGFIDGDGDFVFDTSIIEQLDVEESTDQDLLVKISPSFPPALNVSESVSDTMKGLLADPGQQIRLDDFVSDHLRRATDALSLDNFPTFAMISNEEVRKRLPQYEDIVSNLQTIVILLSRWGTVDQLPLLEKLFARLSEIDKGTSGYETWFDLGWYPIVLLMYVSGMTAISAGKYGTLRTAFMTPVRADDLRHMGGSEQPLILPAITAITRISEQFKRLPGHERQYVPRSEYLYKLLQPSLEDALFLGRTYESTFDRFEILLALAFADLREPKRGGDVWGPPGRFAWKHARGRGEDPLEQLVNEAQRQGRTWEPLKAGLFGGDPNRFVELASGYKQLISKFGW
jgi:Caspase domain